jgi:hypothetical protein
MFDRIKQRPIDYTRGVLAEFATEGELVEAVRTLRDRGYTNLDAITPRPIDEIQELIASERSDLPRYVFIAGVIGAVTAFGVQWWCNAVDYPINVGGRPPFSLPAFIPIAFEIMVLFASLAAFFGVMIRMQLPRLAAPLFDAPGFERATIDRFWVLVSEYDPKFDPEQLPEMLFALGAEQIAIVPEPPPPAPEPGISEPKEVLS